MILGNAATSIRRHSTTQRPKVCGGRRDDDGPLSFVFPTTTTVGCAWVPRQRRDRPCLTRHTDVGLTGTGVEYVDVLSKPCPAVPVNENLGSISVSSYEDPNGALRPSARKARHTIYFVR